MGVLFSDDFNAADSNPIGGSWTTVTALGGLRRLSNRLANASGTDTDSAAYRSDFTPPNNQWVQVTVASGASSPGDIGPALRVSTSATSFYLLTWNPVATQYDLGKFVTGSYSGVAQSTGGNSAADGDVLYLEVQGTSFVAKRNGVALTGINGVTDASLADGRLGVFMFSASPRIDNVSGGDFLGPVQMGRRIYTMP